MKLFVNARFLTQPISGVQRYGIECSMQIKQLYPEAIFVTPGNILHNDIAMRLSAQIVGHAGGHLWEQYELPRFLAKYNNPPLLNLANTATLGYSNNYITIHDLAFFHHPEWNARSFAIWYNFLLPRIINKSKHIFTVSNTIQNEISHFYRIPTSKITVTYNGLSEKMLESKGEIKKENIILSVGTFSIRKNHKNLINGYLNSSLKEDYSLILIGDKSKVFKDAGIDESVVQRANIKIIPSPTENELIDLYERAKILVSLSLYEGFGIPVLEGLYHGCRVICSDIQVFRELYTDYVTFCEPYDIDNIARMLENAAHISQNDKNIGVLLKKYNYKRSAQVILGQIFQ